MTINFNTTTVVVICAIVIGLLFITLRGCYKDPSVNKTQYDSVVAVSKSLNDKVKVFERDTALSNKVIHTLSNAIDSLKKENVYKSGELKEQSLRVALLIAKGNNIKKDTVSYVENCDSISKEAIALIDELSRFQNTNGILLNKVDSLIKEKDYQLKQRDELMSEMRVSSSIIESSYYSLYTSNNQLTRKYKKERTLSRILAVAVLVTGTLYLTK